MDLPLFNYKYCILFIVYELLIPFNQLKHQNKRIELQFLTRYLTLADFTT